MTTAKKRVLMFGGLLAGLACGVRLQEAVASGVQRSECKCWHWFPYPIEDGHASERINFSTQAAIGATAMA